MKTASLLVIGALLGILLLGSVRFAAQQPAHPPVHYHANWALYIDGARVDLTADRYMEDVFQCSADPHGQRPEDRVHMHENNHDVVHVHAAGVAWGHLLANLGFGVGDGYLETDSGRYANGDAGTLKFILDGRPLRSIRNEPIADGARLLISYGSETDAEVLETQFTSVAEDAPQYNTMPDPASCSGQEEEGLAERLRRAFWIG